MKKQTSGKKSLTWLLLALAAVVIVAVGVVIAMLSLGGQEPAAHEPEQTSKLYWNVERKDYVAKGIGGTTGRMKRSDGYYYIRFAVEGEQVDIPVADVALVEWIDMFDLVGLQLDEQGVCVGVLDLLEFTGGLAANNYYVESIDGTSYVCNTSGVYKGTSVTIQIPETANIYNIGGEGLLVGMRGKIAADDQILAVKNMEGVVTDVFVTPYQIPGDVYWNVTRMYDNTTKTTTRERGVTGFFEFEMCHGGEIVTMRTRDVEVANAIDGYVAYCMGLVLDEDGIIIDTIRAADVCQGTVVGSWYHVMDVQGSTVHMKKVSGGSDMGTEVTADIGTYCKTVLTSTGEYTQVKVGDQVHCLTDARDRLAYIFILNRPSETAKICWNVDRQYNSTTQTSLRKPGKDGYYYVTVAMDGKLVELKTKDKAIIDQVDGYVAGFAAELDGDVIVSTFKAFKAIGGSVVMSWYTVTDITNGMLTATKQGSSNAADFGQTSTQKIAENCIVYDVSSSAVQQGSVTEVQVDDIIHCFTDFKGDVCLIYVVTRPVNSPIYYNLERMYDSKNEVTTRERAADGYYYFKMAVNGKQVTLKTKDKEVATAVDSNGGRCVALTLKGDVILKSYSGTIARGYTGGVYASYCDVTSINGRTVVTEKITDGPDKGSVYTLKLSANCKVYDVSTAFENFAGEPTTLRVGDRVHCFRDKNENTVLIFVVARKLQGKIGWNVNRQWDSENKTTTRVPDEEGWYYIDMAIDGKVQTLKTQDIAIVNEIDGAGAYCRGLALEGDVITRAVTPSLVFGTDGGVNGSWVTVTELTANGCKAVKMNGAEAGTTYDIPLAADCKVYNVSGKYKNNFGEETSLKVGAVIHVLVNTKKQATIIYVTTDSIDGGKVGWNVTRKWDSENKTTTRVPDEEGWYYIDMAIDGKVQTLKTRNLAIVNEIDGAGAYCRGLELEGDVITYAASPSLIVGTDGGVNGSWVTVTELTANGCKAVKMNGAEAGTTYDIPMAADCKVYNVSGKYKNNFGEQISLKVGAVIHVLVNTKKEATIIYVITDGIEGGKAGHCNVCDQDVTWVTWDGESPLANNVHYYLDKDIHMDSYVTVDNSNATLFLNGHTITSDSRVFKLSGSTVLSIYDSMETGKDMGGKIIGKGMTAQETEEEGNGGASEGGVIMMWNRTTSLKLYGGTLQLAQENNSVKNGGVVNGGGVFCMYGGTIMGGQVTSRGGAVRMFNTTGRFEMYGGSIVGGEGKDGEGISIEAGANIYLYDGAVCDGTIFLSGNSGMTLSGKQQLKKVILTDNQITIGQEGLDNSSSIGIVDKNATTAFAKVPEAADQNCFFSVEEHYIVEMDEEQTLRLKDNAPPHNHCLCSGNAVGLADHSTCEDVEWTAWSKEDSLPTESGHYYLTCDVSSSSMKILPGVEISLCLNGHAVDTGTNRALSIFGKLNLTDCDPEHKGTVTSSRTALGHVFYVQDAAEFNLYGGNLISGSSTNTAGVGGISDEDQSGQHGSPGTMNMYAGTISGGDVTGDGGLIVTWNGGKLNIHGGTLTGGKAAGRGGILFIQDGELNITGGTITGGQAAKGGGIYLGTNGTMTVTGGTITGNTGLDGTTPSNICLQAGKQMTIGQLAPEAILGVTMEAAGDIAIDVAADVSQQVLSDNEELQVKYDAEGQRLYLSSAHSHCLCAGKAQNVGDHGSCEELAWIRLDQAMFDQPDGAVIQKLDLNVRPENEGALTVYKLATGNYYLAEDITLDHMIQMENTTVNICLNGNTLSGKSRLFRVTSSSVLSITDCGEDGTMVATGMSDAEAIEEQGQNSTGVNNEAGLIMLWNSSTAVNIYSGTLRLATPEEGGGNTIRYGGVICGNGTVNMYGGTVTGGRTTVGGGNIRINSANAKVNLYAGTVSDGKTAGVGGNIKVSVGSITVTGGLITNGQANNGGNIYVNRGQLTVSGGTISLGKAVGGSGGNIYLGGNDSNRVPAIINGTAVIEAGKARDKGGNVYTKYTATLTLGGSVLVTGGEAGISGGGITCFVTKPTIGGDVQIKDNVGTDLYLDGNSTTTTDCYIILDGLGENARIGVSMKAADTFASGVTTDLSSRFFSSDDAYEIIWQDNKLILKAK